MNIRAAHWAMMMNYAPNTKIGQKGIDALLKYRDRYVGSIAGESLGYFYVEPKVMHDAVGKAQTRRQLVEAFTPVSLASNAAKYREVYGKDLDPNPFAEAISCLSVGNIAFAPIAADWGARTIGYESAAATSSLLPMRWAFMRGAARQRGTLTCTYRSCNFGDASTIFSDASSFSSPKNILDNYYSVFSGAGMTWYKFDIWYQYMAGSAMFYHEQGFDEFWKPGGTTAAGEKEVQLSPKGKLVDRFLRLTPRPNPTAATLLPPWPFWSTTPTAGSLRRSGPTHSITITTSPTASARATTSGCSASISGRRTIRSVWSRRSRLPAPARSTCRVSSATSSTWCSLIPT